jgi:hypothetical protein
MPIKAERMRERNMTLLLERVSVVLVGMSGSQKILSFAIYWKSEKRLLLEVE